MKNKKKNPTAEQVIEAFFKCKTYKEMAEALGISVGVLYQRLSSYRARGIALPKRPRNHLPPPPKLDIGALNALIAKLTTPAIPPDPIGFGTDSLPPLNPEAGLGAKLLGEYDPGFEDMEITKEYAAVISQTKD